jgi:chitin disaccharide deacetylase
MLEGIAERRKRNVEKHLIFNADDFGASTGVNRGILECHTRGVLTSTSLMVTGRAVHGAVAMSRDHPGLAIGLHWDVWGEGEREFDIDDPRAVRDEFRRQLDEFHRLLGRMPTHIDSHRHAHRKEHLMPLFRELVEPLGVPLRDDGQVRFVGGFYAQWEWMVTNLEYVGVPFLQGMLREEVVEGWTEFSCHPGYLSPDYMAVYNEERESEVHTLTDPRIRQTIEEQGIRLVSYADYSERQSR